MALGVFFLRDTARNPEGAARVVNHNAEFDSFCRLAEQAIDITREKLDRCNHGPFAILCSVFTHDLGQESPIYRPPARSIRTKKRI